MSASKPTSEPPVSSIPKGWGRLILSVVFPWYIIWRLRQLSTNPAHPEPDDWFRGYERAMSEVRLNLGLEKWS